MPDASVIIVNWNAQKHLISCLSSLVENQNGYTQEIIVVDNGSSDGSPEIVEKEYPHIKLIRNEENLGFAKANNIGINASRGRYLCLVNSDVIVLDDCIDSLVKFMDRNPSVGMAGPRVLNQDRTLQVSCRYFPSVWNNLCQVLGLNYVFPRSAFFSEPFMKHWAHDVEREVDVLSGCFWIVRRKAVETVGLLDEDFFFYGEDIDWCKRFHEAGQEVVFYPQAEAIHFGGGSSSTQPIKFYLEMQRADMQYWRKHHGRTGEISYMTIIFFRQLLRILYGAVKYVVCPSNRKTTFFKLKRSVICIRQLFCISRGTA